MVKRKKLILPESCFEKIAIVVLARDEVHSLRETVKTLAKICCAEDVEQIIIYLAPHATKECKAEAKMLEQSVHKIRVNAVQQTAHGPGLGYFQKLFVNESKATHGLVMSADLEIPLEIFVQMIAASKANPTALVSLSRWKKGGSFAGYPKWQLPLHFIFQQLVRLLYLRYDCTDATAGYVSVPVNVFSMLKLKELQQSIFLEYKLYMLYLGMPLIEIPAKYQSRQEGNSTNSLLRKFSYFVTLFRVRFTPKEKLLEKGEGDG